MKGREHYPVVGVLLGISAAGLLAFACPAAHGAEKASEKLLAQGRELFLREWVPDDRRSHAGDGLGPLFNGNSCTECHHLGGVGGAGSNDTNVSLLSAFIVRRENQETKDFFDWSLVIGDWILGLRHQPQLDRAKLAELHPAFRTSNSVAVHRFSTSEEYAKWRKEFSASPTDKIADRELVGLDEFGTDHDKSVGKVTVKFVGSQRNTPALFGVGLIDAIPERVLAGVAAEQAKLASRQRANSLTLSDRPRLSEMGISDSDLLPVTGRVSKLKDGRAGRFGWKGQVASLREFTLQACAVELGLEVPAVAQSPPPWKKDYKAPGLDLSAAQCDALIAFVAALPRPKERKPETDPHTAEIANGRKLFGEIGCADCHRPKLGAVEGIYSDLLLHDMGDELSDNGFYGASVLADSGEGKVEPIPELVLDAPQPDPKKEKPPKFGAAPREWRTPPLWGFRDSAPYLHDGRANSLAEAVAQHQGEGLESSIRFSELSLQQRRQVELFLKSLTAP
jgi:CxxC motif-containing protein (DUF1111 family)